MPTAIARPPSETDGRQITALKAKLAKNKLSDIPKRQAVADDYMYDFKYNAPLPLKGSQGIVEFAPEDEAVSVAQPFFDRFAAICSEGDAAAFAALFIDNATWRDKIVFTWEYRTFNGSDKILHAAQDLFPKTPLGRFSLLKPEPAFQKPYSDLSFLQVHFKFETDHAGASGVLNLVPTENGLRIWTLHTVIESLLDFPELPNRDGHMTGPNSWLKQREIETHFDNLSPEVVIIGGGHNGLMMAARLKALGVPALIVERNQRIGDNWRGRYEALSLHFPHYADHLPYMPYPEHWPVYTPAQKLGDWLEWYSSAMELYIWTNSRVVDCKQEASGDWKIEVERGGHGKRILTPKHVIMATSLAGHAYMPTIQGSEDFKGKIIHSTEHASSRDWVGKKVLVVGTSSSGFDVAYDFARRGIDVTMLQRSPTYIMSLTNSVSRIIGPYVPVNGIRPDLEQTDRVAYSMPFGPGEELGRRLAEDLESLDQDLILGMEAAGFKTWRGQRDTGTQTLGYTKGGGFYFDAGACKHVINGSIKVEQGFVDHFTADKVVLDGNREKEFDLVVMATGFTPPIDSIRAAVGQEIAGRVGPIWGVSEEGEINGAWKSCGVPNLWIMIGTLQHGRYHSKKMALRIKANLEGIVPGEYRD